MNSLPVSRSITVPGKPAAMSPAIAGRGHVRMTRAMKCTVTADYCNHVWEPGMKIGYARVSTNDQELTAQGTALLALGVEGKAWGVQSGPLDAMAACRAGSDTLLVTKLDRLQASLTPNLKSVRNEPQDALYKQFLHMRRRKITADCCASERGTWKTSSPTPANAPPRGRRPGSWRRAPAMTTEDATVGDWISYPDRPSAAFPRLSAPSFPARRRSHDYTAQLLLLAGGHPSNFPDQSAGESAQAPGQTDR